MSTNPDTPVSSVNLRWTKPDEGCTVCGSQVTVQLHPHRGRQCPDHITVPPGPFRRDLADDMCDLGRIDAAFAYLRAWLLHQAGLRFAAVTL